MRFTLDVPFRLAFLALLLVVAGCSGHGTTPAPDAGTDSGGCQSTCPSAGATLCESGALQTCAAGDGGCLAWGASSPCPDGTCQDGTSCSSCTNQCPSAGSTQCTKGKIETCVADAQGCRSWGAPSACPNGKCEDAQSCASCTNLCPTAGSTECSGGEILTCVADAHGCLSWGSPTACPGGFCAGPASCGSCNNLCPGAGSTECAAGQIQSCVADADGCLSWTSPSACPGGFCADAASCGACNNQCAVAGSTQCAGGQLQACIADANGCLSWGAPSACPGGFCADAASCGACNNTCPSAGNTECAAGQAQSCVADANGCLSWSAPSACPGGFCQDAASCGSCSNQCPSAGSTACAGGQLQTCIADVHGCLSWSAAAACPGGFCQNAASCGACNNTCPSAGSTSCAAGHLQTCVADVHGCLSWSAPTTCPGGFCQDAASCGACSNQCAAGATQCAGGNLSTCVADVHGCLAWGAPSACPYGCKDALTCKPCQDQCAAWGASCSGNVLQTCVVGQQGCFQLLTQTCALGCAGSACGTCTTYADPAVSSVLNDQSGFYKDVLLDGKTAITNWQQRNGQYVGSSWGMSAVDTTTPSSLVSLGVSTLATNDYADNLQLVGNLLYYLDGAGLQIDDVSNPAAPVSLGAFALSDQTAAKSMLSVNGTLACLAAADGVHFIDVSQSQSPHQLSLFTVAGVKPSAVRCLGSYAAVASYNTLEIVNIADPTHPVLAATMPTVAATYVYYQTMQFDGANVFIVNDDTDSNGNIWDTVDAYRFTPPGQLAHTSSLGGINDVVATALSGGELYVGKRESIGVIDVSNPAAMAWKQCASAAEGASGVASDGATLYGAADGLTSYDRSKIPAAVVLPKPNNDYLGGSAVVGSLGYLARWSSGLVIEDLRDPTQPVVLSKVAMSATDVAVAGHYAYVTMEKGNSSALQVYDISSPWTPVLVGSAAGPSNSGFSSNEIGQLKLSGTRAYALCSYGYLCIFDITSPASPTLTTMSLVIANTVGSSSSSSVYGLDGNTLFLPEPSKLHVVDMSNPLAPIQVGTLTLPGYIGPVEIDVAGHTVYLVMPCWNVIGDECFFIVDGSQPAAPALVGTAMHDVHLLSTWYDGETAKFNVLRVQGNRLYLGNIQGGIFVMDVSNPASPQPLTEVWTQLEPKNMFGIDRFLTTYTVAAGSFPGVAAQEDQVIQMCP